MSSEGVIRPQSRADKIIRWRNKGGKARKKFAQFILVLFFSFDLPAGAEVEDGATFMHNSLGSVISSNTVIKKGAYIYQGVTLGRAHLRNENDSNDWIKIIVENNATVGAGAKILCKQGLLTIGEGSVVGANAVVNCSVPPYEIWGGVPAKKLGNCPRPTED